MAFSEVETRVQNPAGKGAKMARSRPTKGGTHKKAAMAKRAAPRSNAAPKYKLKARAATPKHRPRSTPKKNPGEILSLMMGNPSGHSAKKGHKTAMAKSTKYKAASKKNAGRPSHSHSNRGKYNLPTMRRRGKRNPAGLGRPMDWIKGGIGVIGGGVGTRVIPQFFGATNTGGVGYALNGATAIGLAFATHALTKDPVLTAAVAAGGFAALILRIVGDLTPYGQQLSLSGFGDYLVSNFVTPQRIVNQRQALFEIPGNGWGGTYPSPVPFGGGGPGSDVPGRGGDGNSY